MKTVGFGKGMCEEREENILIKLTCKFLLLLLFPAATTPPTQACQSSVTLAATALPHQ
jgi:hypothetical protein